MLKELVEKAESLENKGELNPVGYSQYTDPIRWVIHIYPNGEQVHLEEYAGENRPRPISNRAGTKVFPYPFADEAGYVLGIKEKKDGKNDKNADKKHDAYVEQLQEMMRSPYFDKPILKEAINAVICAIEDGSVLEKFKKGDLFGKTWVAFVYEKEELRGKPLHELPETKAFWVDVVSRDVTSSASQACCICGQECGTVRNLPTKVKLKAGRRQLASFNENAFISHRFSKDDATLGICLPCAEKSSQAINFLLDHYSQNIYEDKNASGSVNNNSSRNQVAIYWLKEELDFSTGEAEFNPMDILTSAVVCSESVHIETTYELISKFLNSPWAGSSNSLGLDENMFYMAILSPNGKGRVVVRDWFHQTAGTVKANLQRYFEGLLLVDAYGRRIRPYTIGELLEPLGETDPNMARALLRTAYLADTPPFSLFQASIRRLRVSGARDGSLEAKKGTKAKGLPPMEVRQRLCTVIKFYLTYGKEDANSMESLNSSRDVPAYQAGRLLAILEQIQRRAATGRLSSTLVDRYYGSASTAPYTVFPLLINMATKAHMPKIRKNYRGYGELEAILEEATSRIDECGGFPRSLSLSQQGEFALGFYHQRAVFNEQSEGSVK